MNRQGLFNRSSIILQSICWAGDNLIAEHEPFNGGVVEDVDHPAAEGSTFGVNLNCKHEPLALVSYVFPIFRGETCFLFKPVQTFPGVFAIFSQEIITGRLGRRVKD